MDFDNIYEEQFDRIFWVYANEAFKYLKANDENFKNNSKKLSNIAGKPKIRELFDSDKAIPLDKKETDLLMDYMSIEKENEIIEEKQLFLCGFKFAFKLMKDLELLKDEI